MFTLENGAGIIFDVSYLTPDSIGYTMPIYWRFTIWGADGALEASYNTKQITIFKNGEDAPRQIDPPAGKPGAYLDSFLSEINGGTDLHLSSADVMNAARVSSNCEMATAKSDWGNAPSFPQNRERWIQRVHRRRSVPFHTCEFHHGRHHQIPTNSVNMNRILTSLCVFGAIVLQGAPLQFNRDIRPILSENCFACHGFDEKERKAKLRLDVSEAAFAKDKAGIAPIIPGKPAKSLIWQRIVSSDPDEVMPPPDSHRQLNEKQKAVLKRWIEEGALAPEALGFRSSRQTSQGKH